MRGEEGGNVDAPVLPRLAVERTHPGVFVVIDRRRRWVSAFFIEKGKQTCVPAVFNLAILI